MKKPFVVMSAVAMIVVVCSMECSVAFDPCPNQSVCDNGCMPVGAVCCGNSSYCNQGYVCGPNDTCLSGSVSGCLAYGEASPLPTISQAQSLLDNGTITQDQYNQIKYASTLSPAQQAATFPDLNQETCTNSDGVDDCAPLGSSCCHNHEYCPVGSVCCSSGCCS